MLGVVHEGLAQLMENLGFKLLAECPDVVPSCRRKLWATHVRLTLRVLFLPGFCAAHSIHCVIVVIDGKDVVGHLYAFKF